MTRSSKGLRRGPWVLWVGLGMLWGGCTAVPLGPSSAVQEVEPVASPSLSDLSWLAGTWVSTSESEPQTVEHWLAPEGGMMLGVNRTVEGGRAVFFEYLRIEVEDGDIVYLASPRGRHPPTRFALTEHGATWAVFENPDHDFPQRIEYRREADLLTMSIHGREDGEARSSRWTMRRAGSDAGDGSR